MVSNGTTFVPVSMKIAPLVQKLLARQTLVQTKEHHGTVHFSLGNEQNMLKNVYLFTNKRNANRPHLRICITQHSAQETT
jgi:hypothetical protein